MHEEQVVITGLEIFLSLFKKLYFPKKSVSWNCFGLKLGTGMLSKKFILCLLCTIRNSFCGTGNRNVAPPFVPPRFMISSVRGGNQ